MIDRFRSTDERSDLESRVAEAGHVHVMLDGDIEFGLSKHDVEFRGSTVVVDSKRGTWTFDIDDVLVVDTEPSGPQ